MKTITIPGQELHDPVTDIFYTTKDVTITIEHSLVSLSKWESKWKKPLLATKDMTRPMFEDYVRCMTVTQNVDPLVYKCLTTSQINEIQEYMADPMTATIVKSDKKTGGRNRFMTSELIYAYMAILRIPYECQKWHLNRLLTLIQVVSIEQEPKKKMSKADTMSRHRSLNAARRAKHPHL